MRILVAGATGAIGRRLIPRLVERGHAVTGMSRTSAKNGLILGLGAEPAVADVLDPEAVAAAVAEARPDVVVHQATALSDGIDPRRLDRSLAATNRLRTAGTENLLEAAEAAGARKLVAQSIGGWPFERSGGPVKTEEEPLDPSPPRSAWASYGAINHLERTVTEARSLTGIVLRYGFFYGPGTALGFEPEGEQLALIRARRFPVVGSGKGVWSFIHIDDAASATVAAIEGGEAGIYNIADDDPAEVREWLPAMADAIGAKPPRKVPRRLARLTAGEFATMTMTEMRGASNRKARQELRWTPVYASWRQGFREGLR